MIVYVETNFPLEIALAQQQAASGETILASAENGQIQLRIPAVAISESYSVLGYRADLRQRLINTVRSDLRQVEDTGLGPAIRQEIAGFRNTLATMTTQYQREREALQTVTDRLTTAGLALPTVTATLRQAAAYQITYDLEPNDSVIYATILEDLAAKLQTELACFVSRDKTAFANRAIGAELAGYNCRYISTFQNGLDYITSQLGGNAP